MNPRIIIRTRDRIVVLSGCYAIEVTENFACAWYLNAVWGTGDGARLARWEWNSDLPGNGREEADRILDLLHSGILAGYDTFDLRGEVPAQDDDS